MPVGQTGGSSGLAMKARAGLKSTRVAKKEDDGLVPTGSTIADKISAFNALRDRPLPSSNVRRRAFEKENDALDKQTSDFAAKHGAPFGRRSRSTLKPPTDEAKGKKRGISADPHLSKSKVEEPVPEPPPPPPPPEPPKPEMKDMACGDDTPILARHKKPATSEVFKAVVQTKVASLNAFKKGVKLTGKTDEKAVGDTLSDMSKSGNRTTQGVQTDPEVPENSASSQGILKKSNEEVRSTGLESVPEPKPRVTFSFLPSKLRLSQGSLRHSEPDLRALDPATSGSAGSSFDSSRSMSDESVATICSNREDSFISAAIQVPEPPPPPLPESSRCTLSSHIPDYIKRLQALYTDQARGSTALTVASALGINGPQESADTLEAIDALILERDRLVQFISMATLDLHKVNLRLENTFRSVHSQLEAFRRNEGAMLPDNRGPKPLTAEHKRFLRFKSYSFPFLTEDSWTNTLVSLEGSEDSCTITSSNPSKKTSASSSKSGSSSDFDFDETDAFMWTNFLSAQETSIGDDTQV